MSVDPYAMTKPQRRAVAILRSRPEGLTPTTFGALMWPDGEVTRKAGQFLTAMLRTGMVLRQTPDRSPNFVYTAGRVPSRDPEECSP